MAGDTGLKPGDVHWVIGVKDAYRAATGIDGDFNSLEARKWFVEKGFTGVQARSAFAQRGRGRRVTRLTSR